MHGIEAKFIGDPIQFDCYKCPFIEVELPDYESAQKIISRSVMIKYFLDPLSEGDSYEALIDNLDKERFTQLLTGQKRIKFKVEAIDKKIKPDQRNSIINSYGDFAPDDIVFDMKNPEHIFMVVSNPETSLYYMGLEVA